MRSKSVYTVFLCIVLLFTTTGTLLAQSRPPYKAWKSTENRLHPLVGRIWSTGDKKFIKREDLISRLAIRDYILLGETHDNPDHHKLQAWIISKVVRYDRKPAVIMEMIDTDQEEVLKLFFSQVRKKKQPKPAESLGAVLEWKERGWPDWKIYQPLAATIISHRLRLLPGNAPRNEVREIGKSGLKKLPSEARKKLALDKKLPFTVLSSLKDELNKGHCNLLPYVALEPMANAQRYRDAVLADNLIKGGSRWGGVLIAGSGHVRNDWGVPFYLKARAPEASIITLSMIEVQPGKNAPEEHLPISPGAKPAVDYVWFTPRQTRKDQCIELKKKLSGKK